jgi:hypothetical protein
MSVLLQWCQWLSMLGLAIFVALSFPPLKIWLESHIKAIMYMFDPCSYQSLYVALYPGHPYPPPHPPPHSPITTLLAHQMSHYRYDTYIIACCTLYLRFQLLYMELRFYSGAQEAVKHGWTGSSHCPSSTHLSFRLKIMFKGCARSYTMPLYLLLSVRKDLRHSID